MSPRNLIELLSESLGAERSTTLVRGAMVRLALHADDAGELPLGQVDRILETIGAAGGMAAIAARFARQRAVRSREHAPLRRIPLAVLVDLLAPTLGDQRSFEIVAEALGGEHDLERGLERDEALGVLDALAGRPGILGVAARFARSSVTNWFA